MSVQDPFADGAHSAATSPRNDLPEPTEAQKHAGNYKKGRIRLHGMGLSIENPAGSVRSGKAKDGTEWSNQLKHHYGYVRGTQGRDKDHIDAFVGPLAGDDTLPVHVVDQVDPETGKFDEHKVLFGFKSVDEAADAYLSNYEEGWQGMGAITPMNLSAFKKWAFQPGRRVRSLSGEIKKYAKGGSVQSTPGGAATVYSRGAQRRKDKPEQREQAKNIPVSLLRGWLAGTAGLPGDLEGLARMLIPGVDNTPALPTSEFYNEWLPLKTEGPVNEAATGAGNLFGGAGATTAVRGAGRAGKGALTLMDEGVTKAGKAGERLAERVVPAVMDRGGLPAQLLADLSRGSTSQAVKTKGGNWYEGSIDGGLSMLKSEYDGMPIGTLTPHTEGLFINEATGEVLSSEQAQRMMGNSALNDWIDTKLNRYIKNEMATPEDPVRELADRGVLHYEPREVSSGEITRAIDNRTRGGFPTSGYGKSDLARQYEALTDSSIQGYPADHWLKGAPDSVLNTMPWIKKVPPEAMVFERTNPGMARTLGFDHLIDELTNAINPNSGLPRELLLKYDALPRVTVPQAVERVSKINAWRAAQKAEADLVRAQNAATQLVKEYPEGYRWVELTQPKFDGALPEGYSVSVIENSNLPEGHMGRRSYAVVDSQGRMLDRVNPKSTEAEALEAFRQKYGASTLEDALKYEGEAMGHCVGGYCPDVMEGRSRIYSLRDAKGQPHVTIEVQPVGRGMLSGEQIDEMKLGAFDEYLAQAKEDNGIADLHTWFRSKYPDLAGKNRIAQIKGKTNAAPKAEYIPFVQDFVKNGVTKDHAGWEEVWDLKNANLARFGGNYVTPEELKAMKAPHIEYLQSNPKFQKFRDASKRYRDFRGDPVSREYTDLQVQNGAPLHPDVPYTYDELNALLNEPEAYTDRYESENEVLSRAIYLVNKLKKLMGD